MMRRELWKTKLASVVLSLVAASCSVHEGPDADTPACLEIDLVFSQDMPDYKEVEYDILKTKADYTPDELDLRYTLKFYPALPEGGYSASEAADYTVVLTRDASEEKDCSFTAFLPEGDWQVRCWTDYVRKGGTDDLFYNTSDFSSVSIPQEYIAGTDYKDAFRGSGEVSLSRFGSAQEPTRMILEMKRPLAKFRFIATDFDRLVTRIMKERKAASGYAPADTSQAGSTSSMSFNPDGYYLRFHYTSFLPSVFNMFKDKPVDSRAGVSFDSEFVPLSEKEVLMGFDYVLTNGHESGVSVQVALYDRSSGSMLSLTPPISVPLIRSEVTTVRGDFLTMDAGSGIGINPTFDGEYVVTVP